jgi:hypothetical protein
MYSLQARMVINQAWGPCILGIRHTRSFVTSPVTYKAGTTKTQTAPKKPSVKKTPTTLVDAKALLASPASSEPQFEPNRVTKAIEEILLAGDGLRIEWYRFFLSCQYGSSSSLGKSHRLTPCIIASHWIHHGFTRSVRRLLSSLYQID